jgi:hypothetical protein
MNLHFSAAIGFGTGFAFEAAVKILRGSENSARQ